MGFLRRIQCYKLKCILLFWNVLNNNYPLTRMCDGITDVSSQTHEPIRFKSCIRFAVFAPNFQTVNKYRAELWQVNRITLSDLIKTRFPPINSKAAVNSVANWSGETTTNFYLGFYISSKVNSLELCMQQTSFWCHVASLWKWRDWRKS